MCVCGGGGGGGGRTMQALSPSSLPIMVTAAAKPACWVTPALSKILVFLHNHAAPPDSNT